MELDPRHDDELIRSSAEGLRLPDFPADEGHVEHEGARIWFAAYGAGEPVILLHGGLGHSGNWGYQVPELVQHGYRAIVIDSRGHGRSTRDGRPFSYELMAADVLTVMDAMHLEKAWLVGWSDGACTALVLAEQFRERVSGVFFFACNVHPGGLKPFVPGATLDRCFARHRMDYSELSPAPDDFDTLVADLGVMQKTQPNYSADDLSRIKVRVTVALSAEDEFIELEHARWLAASLSNANFVLLEGVSHFAPLQRPEYFNGKMLVVTGGG